MAFPIVTVLGAAAGLGQGIFSGISSNAAAAAKNKAATQQWDMQRMQNEAAYQLNNLQNEAQWAWDSAQVAQLRMVETQNAVDQANYGSQLIENAIRNMDINSAALFDRFVTEESLRGTQVRMEYDYSQTKRAAETQQEAANYMRQIRNNALSADLTVQKAQNASKELQEGLLLSEQRDYLEYNVQKAAAIADAANVTARQGVRQGMGNTARRLAMEAGQKLGNVAVEIQQRQQDRANKRAVMNNYFSSELATQLGQLALESEDLASRMKYSTDRYAADYGLAKAQLEKLTIPSFDLGANQYKRELQSLQLQTDSVFQQAGQEYRKREYMDPVKPIAGLAPMTLPPTKAQGQSAGSIIASSLIAGVGGALGGYEGNETWG
jgi:hypothetical protein